MLQVKLGLLDTTNTIPVGTMAAAAAALNVQVTRDLPQFWDVNATVEYLTTKERIPQGVWPLQLVSKRVGSVHGFHQTKNHQPYAKVEITPGYNDWTVVASHEAIEMLVDPSGNRLQTSTAIALRKNKIVDANGLFEYLVECCDPCQSCSYEIGSILVSDFITQHFYEPYLPGTRYSFTGALKLPRQVLPGGYLSWVDPHSHQIKQLRYFGKPEVVNLKTCDKTNLRSFVDQKTKSKIVAKTRGGLTTSVASAKAIDSAAATRAKNYL
jgi:hypothetical protein